MRRSLRDRSAAPVRSDSLSARTNSSTNRSGNAAGAISATRRGSNPLDIAKAVTTPPNEWAMIASGAPTSAITASRARAISGADDIPRPVRPCPGPSYVTALKPRARIGATNEENRPPAPPPPCTRNTVGPVPQCQARIACPSERTENARACPSTSRSPLDRGRCGGVKNSRSAHQPASSGDTACAPRKPSEIAVSERFAIGMTECSLPAVDTDVLVIGAGPGGLAASQQLKQHGVPHKVLERGDTVGHTWANLYDSLVLHTGKRMSSLPGLPFPADYPTFVSRAGFLAYLQRYRDTFGLPVETGVRVDRLERANGTWTAMTSKGPVTSRAVVMATVIVANPVAPRFPAQDRFQGQVMHSVEYRRPEPFRGQRVLVVGVGNSGGEIGAELAHNGIPVTMAVRSGANVVPRELLGIPIQYVAYYVRKLPRPAQRIIVSLVRQIT